MKWIEMSEEELKKRYNLKKHLEEMVKKYIPTAKVFMFGSTANRLAFPGSDIDILIIENSKNFGDLFAVIYLIML